MPRVFLFLLMVARVLAYTPTGPTPLRPNFQNLRVIKIQ